MFKNLLLASCMALSTCSYQPAMAQTAQETIQEMIDDPNLVLLYFVNGSCEVEHSNFIHLKNNKKDKKEAFTCDKSMIMKFASGRESISFFDKDHFIGFAGTPVEKVKGQDLINTIYPGTYFNQYKTLQTEG